MVPEELPPRTRNIENYQSDPFVSTTHNRDRSDLSYNNHPSFFNRLNEGTGSSSHLETPTAQPSSAGPHDLLGMSNNLHDKPPPPPLRKTRAAAELGARKLTSRAGRDVNESKRVTTEPTAPAAPARRSTRLNTLKFSSSKSSTGERETRLTTKDREREQKKRAVSARLRSNLASSAALGGGKEKGGSEDVNVRGNPQAADGALPVTAADNSSGKKRKARGEPSLTRLYKKQMSEAPSKIFQVPQPPQPPATTKDKYKEEAQLYLLDMYRKLGTGYFNLNRYHCPEALAALGSLSVSQRETPRIQCLMGKAYYEMAQYNEVCRSEVIAGTGTDEFCRRRRFSPRSGGWMQSEQRTWRCSQQSCGIKGRTST